jgi:crotonobetainyl-CoA:carnitine CoA-transferase CaiB-like acyl-CoA transferase
MTAVESGGVGESAGVGGVDRADGVDRAGGLPLSGIRVLDISDALGAYCSKLLADLGADVVKAEPPGGDDMRRRPPMTADQTSLLFSSYHANKRGVTVDASRPDALPLLEALARWSDIVVASPTARRPVTGMDRDAGVLSWAADRIVVCITPFGLTGPMRDIRVTPFLSFAMGGGMHWVGQRDGPPLGAPVQIAWDEAGVHAAFGAVTALLARERVGGQLLDLSVHEVAVTKDFLLERYDVAPPEEWGRQVGVGYPPTGDWQCSDGPIAVASHQRHHWQAFLAALDNPDELADPEFANPLFRRDIFEALEQLISGLVATRSRMDLFVKGQASGLPCAPLYTPGEFVHDAQPRARETFRVSLAGDDEVTIPWGWCHSQPPIIELRRPAPRLGEHNMEMFVGELGFDTDLVESWTAAGIV